MNRRHFLKGAGIAVLGVLSLRTISKLPSAVKCQTITTNGYEDGTWEGIARMTDGSEHRMRAFDEETIENWASAIIDKRGWQDGSRVYYRTPL